MFLILITGSRKFTDKNLMKNAIDDIIQRKKQIKIRHGGARLYKKRKVVENSSADYLSSILYPNLIERVMRPQYSGNWTWEDRTAPFRRNIEMLEIAPIPDLVCAFFYLERKGGTLHQVNEAKKRNIPVKEFMQNE